MVPLLVLASCTKESGSLVEANPDKPFKSEEVLSHGMIQLGGKLENPYSVSNVSEALACVYPTRAAASVPATDLYVRFLPKNADEFNRLHELGLELLDHPMDREIVQDGDYYHDPSLKDDEMTWEYSVVPADFKFPEGIRYEILEECFIPDDGAATRGFEDVDWDAVEKASFEMTGNGDMLLPETRAKRNPSGRITIVDDKLGGKVVGVAGVKIITNVFVKISSTHTDKNGNYRIPARYSAKPRYRICFQNEKGFSIGLNLILVPASISALGKDSPSGKDVRVDRNSDETLFRRCAVNNAAYDYLEKCTSMGVGLPPRNLRFWILNILKPSCAVMLHHGAFMDNKLVSNYLGVYKLAVQILTPDITIGTRDKNHDYAAIYSSTVHEMAHASHFSQVGPGFWGNFATYILASFIQTGSSYGSGNGAQAGYCEVGEMWAYHMSNSLYKSRYGTNPKEGMNYWFFPQIFAELEAGGMSTAEIYSALRTDVNDRDALQSKLKDLYPARRSLIEKTFKKYSR